MANVIEKFGRLTSGPVTEIAYRIAADGTEGKGILSTR